VAKDKSLEKKRAKKAAQRRERRASARPSTGAVMRSHSNAHRTGAFPRPEEFAIEPASVVDLQRQLLEAGPLSVVSMLSLEILFSWEDPGRIWLSVEHPTWLTLTSSDPWPLERFATPIEYGEINQLINDHVNKTHGRLMSQRFHASGGDAQLQRLLLDATLQHLDVRKLVFRFQARHEASTLFASVRAEMQQLLGFDIDDLLRIEETIESLITARGDTWWQRKQDFRDHLVAALRGEAKLEGRESDWVSEARARLNDSDDVRLMVMMQWSLASASSVFLVTASDLAAAAGLDESIARSVLRQFSLRAPQPKIADSLPSLYEPLELRPIVQVDDDRWLLHLAPPKLAGAIRPNLEKELKPTPAWERYQQGRAAYLENRTVELLRGTSPHAQSWVGLKYTFDDGNGRREFELDGLVLIDTVAFLVEGKAGALRLEARRGQPQVTVDNLKALAVNAHDQALRARRYIDQAGTAEFRVGAQQVLIPRSGIGEFVLVTTTLDILSAFVTRTYDLVQAGLLSAGQLPWAVALPELEVICDLSEGAGQVVHYVQRRLDLGRRDISASEELDWFGNYLHEGLYFDDEDYAKYDRIQLDDFAIPINAYYEAQHDPRLQPAPKPRQAIPDDIAELIRDLEQNGPSGFVGAVAALLDGNGAARKRLDQGIREAKLSARKKGFGGFRIRMASVVVVVSFHNAEPERDFLRSYVKAAKYSARTGRAVGIAQSIRTPSQIAVVVEDGPFVGTSEGEQQAAAFFSSLKTAEEER
jgi:hypothetical protein